MLHPVLSIVFPYTECVGLTYEEVPGRHMGDICALYYAIAAPFKARTRNKYHSELIEHCFSRAVRNGLVTYRLGKSASPGDTNTNGRRFGQTEDPLEREIESYLVNIIGASKTAHLLGKELMSSPYPIPASGNQNLTSNSVQNISSSSPLGSLPFSSTGRENESSSPSMLLPTNTYQTSSSEASSQIGSESFTQGKSLHSYVRVTTKVSYPTSNNFILIFTFLSTCLWR
ncbi:hypothetical protein MN116_008829 [Schistosoma mekongi]|uniref:Uncharacterized protein n=1 Tax=Schistosoma mekongi TaxID=38744 RepID=A0AAE1Z4F6_SCHME|nr:hypothetical protein MN116_008829 [Schistosoma mekongi]